MGKGRLEAFSDGVIAIIITIIVLEIKVPHGEGLDAIRSLAPIFLTYALAFVNVGLFWANHHHMLHMATRVDGTVLWANLCLLFWLSVASYGAVLFGAAIGYIWLERAIIRTEGPQSKLARAIGRNWKEKVSFAAYLAGIALAFVHVWLAIALYVLSALIWIVPDRRIEKAG